ncbi:MAG: hypothetical protein ACK47B_21825 [Armatimonadota bacterium]
MSYGTGSLVFTFNVAGEVQFRRELPGLVARLQDWTPAFERIAEHFREHMAEVFASEGSANAAGKWRDLSPRYAAWKAKHYPGKTILVREGVLQRALTRRNAKGSLRRIGKNTLTVGARVRTPNGRWDLGLIHQEGSSDGRVPQRKIIAIPPSVQARWLQFLREEMSWEGKG